MANNGLAAAPAICAVRGCVGKRSKTTQSQGAGGSHGHHLGAPDQGYNDGVYLSVTIYGFMTYKLWDQSVSQTEQELLMHLDGGNNGKRYGKTPQSGIPHGMES